jgi:hypothetical protein
MLGQRPALAHLDLISDYTLAQLHLGLFPHIAFIDELSVNRISEAGAMCLTESWSGPESGLNVEVDSELEWEEESDDEASEKEDCETMSIHIQSIRVPEWQQPITDFFESQNSNIFFLERVCYVPSSLRPHTLVP